MVQHLEGFRVAILATDLFEEAELIEPRQALQEEGAVCTVIAPHAGEIQAVQHDRKTQKVKVDLLLGQADPDQFDAVLIPGGAKNSAALRTEMLAQEFVRRIDSLHKPVAAICHGPWLLVSARLARGRHLTSYHTIREDLRDAGAFWSDREVVRDGNWVSSRQPGDIPRFNQEMINLFIEHRDSSHKAA